MKVLIVKAEGVDFQPESFHFFDKDEYVDITKNRGKAEELNYTINNFVLNAKKEYESNSFLSLYRKNNKFLLNIPVQDKDIIGRITSIVFLFEVERNSDEEINEVLDMIEQYAKKCNRTISQETYDEISKVLNKIILKQRGELLDLGISISVAFLTGATSYLIIGKKFLSILLSIGAGAICYSILKNKK